MARQRKGQDRGTIKPVVLSSGKKRWRLVIDLPTGPDGKRRQATSTYDSEADAKSARRRILLEIDSGTHVARDTITVEAYIERWLAGLHNKKATTRKGYGWNLRPVVEAYGSKPLQSLTKADLDRLVAKRQTEGVKPRTIALTLVVLGAALKAAQAEGLVTRNVAALVDKPASEEAHEDRVGQAWTAEQARTFLTHVAPDRYAAAWRLSLYGLRRGEVLGLRWQDIDLTAGTVTVRSTRVVAGGEVVTSSTKNRRSRTLKVGPEVIEDLLVLQGVQEIEAHNAGGRYNPDGLVVVNEAGDPIRPETYSDYFRAHAKAAGLPRIRLHDLRHTAASLLLSNGVPLTVAAKVLGHDPQVLAQVYSHPYEDDEAAATAALARAYANAS